ncbi:MAG: imidazoleglycerol-phosphate dehydratase HisB [Calditrichia bacterium]
MRKASIERKTKETNITCDINLDNSEAPEIISPSGFLNHMLTSFAIHAGISLNMTISGDTEVDMHHTVEDTGIVLGQAINRALEDRSGIQRFASNFVPLDEALSLVVIDICGRPFLKMECEFHTFRTGNIPTDLWTDFFQGLVNHSFITMHIINQYGRSDHHIIESIFKAFAISFKQAIQITGNNTIPSTKGVI